MATLAAEGTLLYVGSASSAMSSLAQIVDITPPGYSRAAVPRTWLESTWKQFRAGRIPDGGEVQFTIELDHSIAAHMSLLTSATDSTTPFFQVRWADLASSATVHPRFQGFLTAMEPETAEDEANIRYAATVKVTGSVTYAAAPA